MTDEPIFVLGLMRSGTTFVQRLLNSHRSVTIWGEHGGALRPLLTWEPFVFDDHHRGRIAEGYDHRSAVIGELQDPAAFDPYVSPVPPEGFEAAIDDAVRAQMRALFTSGLGPNVRWGFKETRYAGNIYRRLSHLYPNAHFVFVTRAPLPWMSSVIRAPFRDDLRPDQLADPTAVEDAVSPLTDLWVQRTRATVNFVEEAPERRLIVTQEGLNSVDAAQNLFSQLGIHDPPTAIVERVLSVRAGSSDRTVAWTTEHRGRLEELIGESLGAADAIQQLESRRLQSALT